jgi:hypothetical protein
VAQMLPVRYLTPDTVATYIETRGLYRAVDPRDLKGGVDA